MFGLPMIKFLCKFLGTLFGGHKYSVLLGTQGVQLLDHETFHQYLQHSNSLKLHFKI